MPTTTEHAPVGISANRLKALLDADESFTLIDTRDEESFEKWRIAEAEQYFYKPNHAFDPTAFTDATGVERDDPVVTICALGKSSNALAYTLSDAGFTDVRYVEDGMEAWSGVYDAVEIATPGSAAVVQLQRRAKGCLGYVVADPDTGSAAVVDPTRYTEEFVDAAQRRDWEIERVLDTHVHADHLSGGRALAEELGVPYHLGAAAAERGLGYEFEALGRNDVVTVGGVDIKAVYTPGHTSEMVSYLVGHEAMLTGDTVFVDGVGRTELQFGDADAERGASLLYESLQGTILASADDTVVLPGHFHVSEHGEYTVDPGSQISTTVGELRTGLDVLEYDRERFAEYILENVPQKPPNYERVIDINRGKAVPESEQEAIELELGPNRCAAE